MSKIKKFLASILAFVMVFTSMGAFNVSNVFAASFIPYAYCNDEWDSGINYESISSVKIIEEGYVESYIKDLLKGKSFRLLISDTDSIVGTDTYTETFAVNTDELNFSIEELSASDASHTIAYYNVVSRVSVSQQVTTSKGYVFNTTVFEGYFLIVPTEYITKLNSFNNEGYDLIYPIESFDLDVPYEFYLGNTYNIADLYKNSVIKYKNVPVEDCYLPSFTGSWTSDEKEISLYDFVNQYTNDNGLVDNSSANARVAWRYANGDSVISDISDSSHGISNNNFVLKTVTAYGGTKSNSISVNISNLESINLMGLDRFAYTTGNFNLYAYRESFPINYITGIKITEQPEKKSYIAGETFDNTGMEVKVVYSDGTEQTITDYKFDSSRLKAGQTSMYVTYENFYATVPISVADKAISSIAVTTQPNKTSYVDGEVFNPLGMVVTATYTDGSKEDLASTEYSYPEKALQAGTKLITISAGDKTASVPITVVEKEITAIAVTKAPSKISYIAGQSVDITGMIVTATYNDGTTAVINDYSYSPNVVSEDTTYITVSKDGKTATTPITVTEKGVVSIEITSNPDYTEYTAGEVFNSTGMTVVAHYNDGSTAVINDYTVDTTPLAAGQTKVYITYDNNLFATVDITVNAEEVVTLTGIKVTTAPDKVSYIAGQTFDKTGMEVKAVYSNGSEQTITNYSVDTTPLVTGQTSVYITYNNYYTSVPVSVASKAISSIEVTNQPDKTSYVEGEMFDPTGMVVTATYTDRSTEDLASTEYSYSPSVALTSDDNVITISAGSSSATVPITVVSKEITSIAVTKSPDKISYIAGQAIDVTGMIVTATYNDGSTAVINDYTYSPNTVSADTTYITVSKDGKTATTPITVTEKGVVSIEVTSNPDKTEYTAGEYFNPTGMIVVAHYNDGTTETITNYKVDGNKLAAGQAQVYITYDNVYATVPVTVNDIVTLTGIKVTELPAKVSYIAGQTFDKTGMIVKAVYSDGSEQEITDYIVTDAPLTEGTANVYVTYENFFATVSISVAAKEITDIEVITPPSQTSYVEGQLFNPNGMVVEATYTDGSKEPLATTEYSYSPSVALTSDDNVITVSAGDKTATTPISVVKKEIVKIEVTKNPDKMDYVVGQPFIADGMIVEAYYNDGTSAEIFDYTYQPEIITGTNSVRGDVNGDGAINATDAALVLQYVAGTAVADRFDSTAADCDGIPGISVLDANWILRYIAGQETGDTGFIGKEDVVISKDGVSDTITVNVVEKAIVRLEVTKLPNKTEYLAGQEFDPTGMEVTATYNDGSTAVINDYTVDTNKLSSDTEAVYVTCDGVYTTVPVTVKDSDIVDIKVLKNPVKTEYVEGESFDDTGMIVQITYEDGTTEIIIDYKINPAGGLNLDDNFVTISKGDVETTVSISVAAKEITGIEVTKLPYRLEYEEGEVFNPEGMEVTAYYNDGTSAVISDYTYSTDPFEAGDTSVTIEYKGFTDDVSIILSMAGLESLVPEKNGDLNRDGSVTPEDAMILSKILGGVAEYGYKAVHTGDVDNDGVLTDEDVTLIKNYINGNVSLSDEGRINADIDGDGEVTEYDAVLVDKAVLGMWSLDTVYAANADANDDGEINMLDVIWILNAYYKHTTIDHIEIITPPNKVNYVEGQTFDKSGMVVEVVYKDDTREEITDYSYPVRPLEMKDTSVIISFDGHEAEQPITVYKKAIIGSDDDKYPTTESSTEVTTSNSTEVTTENEGSETTTSSSDVSTETTTSSDGSTEATTNDGGSEVTTEDSTETTTEENNGNSAGVKIINLPTKRAYVEGEVFDPTGLVIEISYNDGSKEYIREGDVTVDETPLKLGDVYGVIYYEYNGLTEKINVPITVIKKEISSVEIITPPDKTEYEEGETFDPEGIEIEITYNDGSIEIVGADDITVVDDQPLTPDDDSVTVAIDDDIEIEVPVVVNPITTETTTETTTEVTTDAATETTTRRPSSGGGAGGGLVVNTTEATTEDVTDEVVEDNTEATSEDNDNRFEDVIGHWAEDYIEYLHENGIVNGVTDDQFEPDWSTKRGDFALVLDRLLDLNKSNEYTFTDVDENSYYAQAIANCAAANVFIGYGDGTFKPEQTISREEMFVIMAKLFAGTDYDFTAVDTSVLDKYNDGNSVSWWAAPYVAYLSDINAVVGDNGNIKPQNDITRAEMAVVIYNYLTK